MGALFVTIRKGITNLLAMVVTFVYNIIFSKFVSIWAYEAMVRMLESRIKSFKSLLDVGVGTGLPLSTIFHNFSPDAQILGIDIDKLYVQQTKKLFKTRPNVEIK
jgi:ubiquinone/menaquinone biosynthesis C-methylase UbiE